MKITVTEPGKGREVNQYDVPYRDAFPHYKDFEASIKTLPAISSDGKDLPVGEYDCELGYQGLMNDEWWPIEHAEGAEFPTRQVYIHTPKPITPIGEDGKVSEAIVQETTANKFTKIEVLDIDLGKHLEHHEDHGFVLSAGNDSVYFSYDDAIKICKFIADRPKVDYAIVMVKGEIEQKIFKKWIK